MAIHADIEAKLQPDSLALYVDVEGQKATFISTSRVEKGGMYPYGRLLHYALVEAMASLQSQALTGYTMVASELLIQGADANPRDTSLYAQTNSIGDHGRYRIIHRNETYVAEEINRLTTHEARQELSDLEAGNLVVGVRSLMLHALQRMNQKAVKSARSEMETVYRQQQLYYLTLCKDAVARLNQQQRLEQGNI